MRVVAGMRGRRGLLVAAAVLVVIALVVGAYLLLASQAQAAPQQPIQFNHRIMVQVGITCVYCHTEAMKSPSAGMPSMQKCMSCHSHIVADSPVIQQVAAYWQRGEPIPWVRVNQLPRFVYFSHQVHIANGLNCERCHGDVGQMTVAQPVVKMDMGWCLSCHEQQANAQQLMDCVVCHQ